MTVTEVAHIQVLFRTVGPNQKIKMKARNLMAPLHHLKVSSTRNKGSSFSLLFATLSLVLYLHIW